MYSKAAEEEDNNMILNSQEVADGILIFVSLYQYSYSLCIKR